MDRKGLKWLLWAGRNPVEAILFVLALTLGLFAAYLASPLYEIAPTDGRAIAEVFSSGFSKYGLAAIYGAGSVYTMWGALKLNHKHLAHGAYIMFILYLFVAVLRVITIGWTPLFWLFLLGISLTAGIAKLWLSVGRPRE